MSNKDQVSYRNEDARGAGGNDPNGRAPDRNSVDLQRTGSVLTPENALWTYIRERTRMLSFRSYAAHIDEVMCNDLPGPANAGPGERPSTMRLPFPGVDRYTLLKTATEMFVMSRCGVKIDPQRLFTSMSGQLADARDPRVITNEDNSRVAPNQVTPALLDRLWNDYVVRVDDGKPTLPYLKLVRLKLRDLPIKEDGVSDNCFGILAEKLRSPCMIELIWSYWHEEGMLVQTMNAISHRFQNRRRHQGRDPLAHLEMDPLRPLNNILWGYVQDEQHRLNIERRALEYVHHYGFILEGRAVPSLKTVDSRSKFLEAFHSLLNLCARFFREDDDTTTMADAFPTLNGLKATHLIITHGAHNQHGDLPWTARMEMLMEEWLLARPEMREFLPTRVMAAYPEPWMDRVEAMKRLQGWDDTAVVHFRDLAVFGEQLLLGIRFHAWNDVFDPTVAKNWARYWRAEIQGYIHAYRAVTGVDLTAERVDTALPSVHLRRRLREQLKEVLPASVARRALVNS